MGSDVARKPWMRRGRAPALLIALAIALFTIGASLATAAAATLTFSPNGDGIRDSVTVRYRLSTRARVKVTVTKGRKLIAVIQKTRVINKGMRSVKWNGKDSRRRWVGAGLYSVNVYATSMTGRRARPYPFRVRVKAAFPPITRLMDGAGHVVSSLPVGDTLTTNITGLQSNTHYRLKVQNAAGASVTEARLLTDQQGKIPASVLAYDIGFNLGSGAAARRGANVAASLETGTYLVIVYDDAGVELRRYTFTVNPGARAFYSSDSAGFLVNSFLSNETVWAHGTNFPMGTFKVYTIEDTTTYVAGMNLNDVSGRPDTVTVSAAGTFTVAAWPAITALGAYDLVADLNNNGKWDTGEPVDGAVPTGFMVQNAAGNNDIVGQVACDANRNYLDVFYPTQNVYAYINPISRSRIAHRWVHKYVVAHRDTWLANTPLIDLSSGGVEQDAIEWGCTNEGRLLVWTAPLKPGVYDLVIDVNKNALYDPGVDLVDNINTAGQRMGGFMVPSALATAPSVRIAEPAEGQTIYERHVSVEGTTSVTTGAASLFVNGTLQSTVLVQNGRFKGEALLKAGANTIRVEVASPNGLGKATTHVLTSFQASKIWVKLTWTEPFGNGETSDVDLHVWQPGSPPSHVYYPYASRGTSSSPVAGIGWLDVDDLDGWGPENYTVQPTHDAAGTYQVKVNYYDADRNKDASGNALPVDCTVQVVLNEGAANQVTRTFGPFRMTTPLGYAGNSAPGWSVCTINWPTGTITSP